jgi:internalin A
LPAEVGDLVALKRLDVGLNRLTALPKRIGQLTALTTLELRGNPLETPPPDVVAQGTQAVLEFLRNLPDDSATV